MARSDYTHKYVNSERVALSEAEIDACVARETAWSNGDAAKSWAALRTKRDQKLAECDLTAVSDTALSDDKKAEWVAYRKKLRDLPASYNDTSVKGEITWPSEPS